MHRMIYHITYGEDNKAFQILPEEDALAMVKSHPNEWFLTHIIAMNAQIDELTAERDEMKRKTTPPKRGRPKKSANSGE